MRLRVVMVIARALPSDEVWVEQLQRGLSVPFFIDNLRYEPSVTLGWTRAWLPATNDFSTLLSSLLHQVESTMYTAKRRGRGSIERFDADRFAAQLQRQALARALPTALSQREFWLAFQPIVDPQTATLGYEALLRWRSSRFGEVSPADFIPLAEQSRAILGIGRWVLHEACSTMAQLVARQPAKACYVAVNVSAMQFLQPEFELDVQRALSASGLSADRLCLEVTESLLAEDLQIVSSKMQRLADQGVRFALDDFGTGYSNLLQLRTLPLDTLKIDRSFTRDILEDHEDALLVRSIIELAHRLHLQVVAEGVETSHQAAWLAEHHCDAMQGFYYGRPAPLLGGPPQR
ncbi:MAG: putative bifunctional diguanylate cyclase/phosphodiesterase [Tepidimonas sp.]|uniref:putative bifunctional diguanylate cyclase/phosphodiesterase n=1 Tax=Tepidimonas sp. TaxID=2002775 RepID=UPI004054EA18